MERARRTERMSFTVTPAEKELATRLADASGGLSRAALLRQLVRREGTSLGLWPPQPSQLTGHRRAPAAGG